MDDRHGYLTHVGPRPRHGFSLRSALAAAAAFAAAAIVAPAAGAVPLTASAPVEASPTNLLAGCAPDGSGINFPDSEVEPYVDVNPTDTDNVVGGYQQDRYSNGGAKGNVASVSFDGGATWTQVAIPAHNRCTGPTARFERATDPWVSFGPDGVAHFMTLSIDPDPPTGGFGDNAMVYNRSTNGGLTWESPILLKEDTDPRFLNDKNAITADPNDGNFVYAVWDRLQTPRGETVAAPQGRENIFGLGFRGPAWFTRTTNGGDSFEPARIIYNPKGANNQTIGNQIVVRPQGTVINFFNEIVNFSNREGGGQFEFNLSLIRSFDKGATWERNATRVSKMFPMDRVREDGVIDTEPVACPDPGDQGACPIRTGDILFDVAVNRTNGNLYAVWQDARFSGFRYDTIAFSQSTNGGQSWSAPVRINPGSDAGARVDDRQAFTPAVHVADDGTVGVSFYDFRNNTAADGILATDQFAVHCHASCTQTAGWAATRVTPTPFDMRRAPFAGGYFVGDYEGLGFIADDGDATAPGDAFASFFSQSHGADPASAFLSRLAP
jgi:hypothetical protein